MTQDELTHGDLIEIAEKAAEACLKWRWKWNADLDDLFSEAYVRVLETAEFVRSGADADGNPIEGNPRGYIYRAAYFRLVDLWREEREYRKRRRSLKAIEAGYDSENDSGRVSSPRMPPTAIFDEGIPEDDFEELLRQTREFPEIAFLVAVPNSVTDEQRKALWLRYQEELPIHEVAKQRGIDKSTAQYRIEKALERVQRSHEREIQRDLKDNPRAKRKRKAKANDNA